MTRQFAHVLFTLLVLMLGSIVSCETKPTNVSEDLTSKSTLYLNFYENVQETNPLEVETESEKFIAELVFERLYRVDGSSTIIKDVDYNEDESKHSFVLFTNRRFHDDSPITTKDIRALFKYLLKNKFDHESVRLFFSSMQGYGRSNWLKENRGIADSIPSGFEIINDSTFNITFIKNNSQLTEWLQAPEFTLFKQNRNNFIGSGPFQLSSLNSDLSAHLIKSKQTHSALHSIKLSFIKDADLVVSEFRSGEIDLIYYKPYHDKQIKERKFLDRMLSEKYPEYQVNYGNEIKVRYGIIKYIEDSLTNAFTETVTKGQHKFRLFPKTNTIAQEGPSQHIKYKVGTDSTSGPIQVKATDSLFMEYFENSDILEYVKTNQENIYPTDPQIVIKDTILYFDGKNMMETAYHKLAKSLISGENEDFMILDTFESYVIYNNILRGIYDYDRLSHMVNDMHFINPKTY